MNWGQLPWVLIWGKSRVAISILTTKFDDPSPELIMFSIRNREIGPATSYLSYAKKDDLLPYQQELINRVENSSDGDALAEKYLVGVLGYSPQELGMTILRKAKMTPKGNFAKERISSAIARAQQYLDSSKKEDLVSHEAELLEMVRDWPLDVAVLSATILSEKSKYPSAKLGMIFLAQMFECFRWALE
jgi:hypothetical protein